MKNHHEPIKNRNVGVSFVPMAGFTLIELLIVIVIIGILSTLVIANFVGVRARARDAQRKTDLSQIRTALQLYYSDEGAYPSWTASSYPDCGSAFIGATSQVTYIKKMPCDPKDKLTKYVYTPSPTNCQTTDSCTGYSLIACLENTSDADSDAKQQGGTPSSSCPSGTVSYTVTNP